MTSTRSYRRARPVPRRPGGAGAVRGRAVRPADGPGAGGGRWSGTAGIRWSPPTTTCQVISAPPRAGPHPPGAPRRPRPRGTGAAGRRGGPGARPRPRGGPGTRAAASRRPAAGPGRAVQGRCRRGRPRRRRRARRRWRSAAPSGTAWRSPGSPLAFGVLIAVGELARRRTRRGRPRRPRSAARTARRRRRPRLRPARRGRRAADAPTGCSRPSPSSSRPPSSGLVPHVARGRGPALDHLARRVLTVGFAAACFQPLYNTGRLAHWLGEGPAYALFLLGAARRSPRCATRCSPPRSPAPAPAGRTGRCCATSCGRMLGIGSAICATGVVISLARRRRRAVGAARLLRCRCC